MFRFSHVKLFPVFPHASFYLTAYSAVHIFVSSLYVAMLLFCMLMSVEVSEYNSVPE